MPQDFKDLAQKAQKMGATGSKVIDTDQVVFDPRSHLKCRFGCNRWGNYWTCPPHTAVSQEKFEEAFARYQQCMILRTKDEKTSQKVTLALEKAAMLEHGSMFAMALVLCNLCEECAYPEPCRLPHLARPSMDCFGIDIGATVGPLGFKVEFDPEGNPVAAFYSMVLLD